jgi:hypothetical protein
MTLVAGAAHAHVSACFRVCKDVYPVFSLFCFCTPYTALVLVYSIAGMICGPLVYTALLGYFITLVLPLSPVPGSWLSEATS